MNSFKELQRQQVTLFAERKTEKVYERLSGTLDTMRFLGSILEVYMPVMADTVVCLTGGESNALEEYNPWLEESTDTDYEDLSDNKGISEPRGPRGDDDHPIR